MALVYSCCFWFSLRLGGILIGIFSFLQAVIILILCLVGYTQPKDIKTTTDMWLDDINLIYMKVYVQNIKADPEHFFRLIISLTSVYSLLCVLYIYGAFKCNNVLMVGYILVELARVTFLTVVVTTLLLMLKQNTMDIGLLIGASVIGGFILLGIFYLWVCAANLPILINEKERDDQAATIQKLEQLLAADTTRKFGSFNDTFWEEYVNPPQSSIFILPRYKRGMEK